MCACAHVGLTLQIQSAVPAAAPKSVSRELRAERPAHNVSASRCAVCGPRARRPEGARAGAGAGCRRCPHGAASAGGWPHPPLRTAEPRALSAAVPGPAAQGIGGGAGCAAPARRPSALATPTASQTTRGTVGAGAGAKAGLFGVLGVSLLFPSAPPPPRPAETREGPFLPKRINKAAPSTPLCAKPQASEKTLSFHSPS